MLLRMSRTAWRVERTRRKLTHLSSLGCPRASCPWRNPGADEAEPASRCRSGLHPAEAISRV